MVPKGLPHIGLPRIMWSWDLIEKLAPTAFSMFVVILAQSAATSRAYAARYHEHFSENTDLVGLGLANIGAGLSGTFVVNGSPTKTQMVDSAGGRTQLSLLVTAVVVLIVLLFLTAPLAYMPEAVLSAVVFLRNRPNRSQRHAPRFGPKAIGVLGGPDHNIYGRARWGGAGHLAGHQPVTH
jgi:MFS superfamily sulfate permease-like transporter